MRCFKVGGIRFLRIGRLQFSFCLCRPRPSALQRLAILSAETHSAAPLRPSLCLLVALGAVQALTCVALYVAH